MANAEVLTTIQLTGDPGWTIQDMTKDGKNVVLIQSDDSNIGILGNPDDIRTMLNRIEKVLPPPGPRMGTCYHWDNPHLPCGAPSWKPLPVKDWSDGT